MGGGGEVPELALARSERFVRVLSAPLVEQPKDFRVVAFLSLTLSVTKGSLSRDADGRRAVAALHAPGLIATSQLSNPRTQQVAPRARIA